MEFPWDQIPTNPVRQFQLLYCLWLSLAMLRNGRQHYRFYRWFYSSDLGLATKRGLGAHPSRIYGIFTPPILSPAQLAAAGVAFTACLLAACLPLAPRVFLFLAYLLYFLYFPQMFAEATLSGHGSILIPSMLFLLACSPSLDHEVQSRSEWPLTLIRIYLASGYFSSGMCKLLCGARFGKFWGMGPTLQYYIFDALWSRPAGPTVRRIQETAITAPRIMTFLATSSMFFEIGFISAPFSDMMSVFFGLNGLAFHAGIMLFQVLPPLMPSHPRPPPCTHRSPSTVPPSSQGLDFCTWWSPALLAFVVGVPSAEPWRAILNGWQLEPYFFLPAAIYTSLQVLTAVTLRDFWLDDVLPLSCCPMFMLPRNPFDAWPKWWTMTDAPLNGSTRASGAMEPLYWSPASPVFEMPETDAPKLPQKVLWFGATTDCPPEALKFIKPECLHLPFLLFSNFELPPSLRALLEELVAATRAGKPADAWDAKKMQALLDLQQRCLDEFDKCAAASRDADRKAA